MTLPPPPSGFSAQQNVGALIALKATATDMVPDTFGRNAGNPVQAVLLDITVLDGPNAGQQYPGSTNTSALGRQFLGCVGDGRWYYGRITGQPVGQGTALVLTEPRPGDEYLINNHKQMIASYEAAQGWQAPPQPTPQNWQQQQPQQQPAQPQYAGAQPGSGYGYGQNYPPGQQQPPQPQQGPYPQGPTPPQPQQPTAPPPWGGGNGQQQPQQPGPWSQPPGQPQQPQFQQGQGYQGQQQQGQANVPPTHPPSLPQGSPYDDPPPF